MEFKELCDILENAGQEIRSYSGRNMGGRNCLGIDTNDNPIDVVLEIILSAVDNEANRTTLQNLCEKLQGAKAKTDSMGRGTIIYWPGIKWEEIDSEDDSED